LRLAFFFASFVILAVICGCLDGEVPSLGAKACIINFSAALMEIGLSTGAPAGYLDPYPQVFSERKPYLDL